MIMRAFFVHICDSSERNESLYITSLWKEEKNEK